MLECFEQWKFHGLRSSNTISVGDDPRNHTTGLIPDPIQSSREPERSGIFVFGETFA